MPNTDQAQVPLQDLFTKLDQMRSLLKTVEANFKAPVGTVSASLAPGDIQALKTQYIQLISQMQQDLRNFPDASAYFP